MGCTAIGGGDEGRLCGAAGYLLGLVSLSFLVDGFPLSWQQCKRAELRGMNSICLNFVIQMKFYYRIRKVFGPRQMTILLQKIAQKTE